jgi:hypothetical protein
MALLASLGAAALKPIVGIYIRLARGELERLRAHPEILPKYDPRVAITDGRGLDIGRAWEELAVFVDGGVRVPDTGPTVGEVPLPHTDARASWSLVEPERVAAMADTLDKLTREDFERHYESDGVDTAEPLPGSLSGGYRDHASYLYQKLRQLARHYAAAADAGEGMLVRIGERV